MKTFLNFIFIFCLLFFVSCKKTNDGKHCWQILDATGNLLVQICDKTEAELLACANNGCGTFNGGHSLTRCNYYQTDGPRSCWLINNKYYDSMTESQAHLYASCFFGDTTNIAIKTPCENCQNYFSREEITYKPTNSISYSAISFNKYCGDSLIIVQRGDVTLKNTADTLIVLKYSANGVDFQ
jgi:hypothetical protein